MISGIWKSKTTEYIIKAMKKFPEDCHLIETIAKAVTRQIKKEGWEGNWQEVESYITGPLVKGNQIESDTDEDYIKLPDNYDDYEFGSESSSSIWEDKSKELITQNKLLSDTNETLLVKLSAATAKAEDAEKRASESKGRVMEVRVKRGPKTIKKIKKVFHKEFARVVSLCQARKNVMLYGPTGTGKTHLCGMLAEALDLRFGFISCTSGMSESKLTGSILPTGSGGKFEHQLTEFLDIFENGGLYLLDEMDRADPNVLMIINAALANGKVAVPSRKAKPYAQAHKDFVCICATNTVGTGADRTYTAANKLDMSTLNRFWKVKIDYDQDVERLLVDDVELLEYSWIVRAAIQEHRLEQAMSTRYIMEAYELKTNSDEYEWTQKELDIAYFAGWPRTQFDKVCETLRRSGKTPALCWDDLDG